jgi:2-succinyl-5-enolpyruvyl-6-hydroxy-3-cyclohexene-1-carboxylate synthase
MIVIGQDDAHTYEELSDAFQQLKDQVVILYEPLSLDTWKMTRFEEVLSKAQDETLLPDFILYIGDTLVSKRLKAFLRKAEGAETWTVRADGEIHDTFMNLKGIIEGQPAEVILEMATVISRRTGEQQTDYLRLWAEALKAADGKSEEFEPEYSEMATVRYFEQQLEDMEYPFHVQYANSSAVRLANIYAGHHVYCNRGVNGIEGCLSTAAGMSLVTADFVFCVIGDLSFFYDQNALWNHNLKGNLRVILLNNGCGGIFDKFEGLKQSDARDLVMARHQTSAQGICTQNDCGYIKAKNMDEMQLGVVQLLTMDTKRPVVLEVITDADVDTQQLQRYFER